MTAAGDSTYRKMKLIDHFLVSVLFTILFFAYMYVSVYFPFSVVVPALGILFIVWALIERRGKPAVVERLFPFYRKMLKVERHLAPKTFESNRLGLRSSLWVVGVVLVLIGLLDFVHIIDAEPEVFPFTMVYPLALIVVNINVFTRHKRMEAGDERGNVH